MQLFRGQALWDLLASYKDSPAAKVQHRLSPLVAMPAECFVRSAVPLLTGSLKSQAVCWAMSPSHRGDSDGALDVQVILHNDQSIH
ncbi:hypothetical protein AOLI_G00152020 [Acnodon oligacanthus]